MGFNSAFKGLICLYCVWYVIHLCRVPWCDIYKLQWRNKNNHLQLFVILYCLFYFKMFTLPNDSFLKKPAACCSIVYSKLLHSSWFQTFAVFCMLYVFFWVISRCPHVTCRHFGTLCLFLLHRRVGMKDDQVWKCWGIYTGKGLACK